MRPFDKEKNIARLKMKNNKNVYVKRVSIFLACLILVSVVMLFAFARFENSSDVYTLINGKVTGSYGDINVAYIVNGVSQSNPPAKGTGYAITNINCNNAEGKWDSLEWQFYAKNITGKVKCNLTFEKNEPNPPELYAGMIPVYFNNGKTMVADTSSEWYNYENHQWANAVLVSNPTDYFENGEIKASKKNTEITSGIIQYYVWIPRYEYVLFSNATNLDYMINGGNTDEQMVDVSFVGKNVTNDPNKSQKNSYYKGELYVHPAFTFGNTELSGIWVGKFESSGTSSAPTILPDSKSLINVSISTMFNAARSIEGNYGTNTSEIDTHMMKNMEWGAVAFLAVSRYGLYNPNGTCYNSDNTVSGVGCQIWINNVTISTSSDQSVTGCSAMSTMNDARRAGTTCGTGYEWNGSINKGRSATTGTIYGIYDMVGGDHEYVMANRASNVAATTYTKSSSGFSAQPSDKYIEIYEQASAESDHTVGRLGDAMREVLKTFGNLSGSWYDDSSHSLTSSAPWNTRGGKSRDGSGTGIFYYYGNTGAASTLHTFRVVLTAE